jgi:hypothetical protein
MEQPRSGEQMHPSGTGEPVCPECGCPGPSAGHKMWMMPMMMKRVMFMTTVPILLGFLAGFLIGTTRHDHHHFGHHR